MILTDKNPGNPGIFLYIPALPEYRIRRRGGGARMRFVRLYVMQSEL